MQEVRLRPHSREAVDPGEGLRIILLHLQPGPNITIEPFASEAYKTPLSWVICFILTDGVEADRISDR